MKNNHRLNLLIWALAMPFMFYACHDTDDLPEVYFDFEETGGIQHGGALHVENGDSIWIKRISVVADKSTPTSMITACDYYWDGLPVGPAFAPDFGRKFYVYGQHPGNHVLGVRMLVAAKGYPLTTYATNFPVIVADENTDMDSLLPDGTDIFSLRD